MTLEQSLINLNSAFNEVIKSAKILEDKVSYLEEHIVATETIQRNFFEDLTALARSYSEK